MGFRADFSHPCLELVFGNRRILAEEQNPFREAIRAFLSHNYAIVKDTVADRYVMSLLTPRRVQPPAPRIAILTSVETRHRFFANSITGCFDVAALAYARPTYAPANVDDSDLKPSERAVVAAHFAERSRTEEKFFGHNAQPLEPGLNRAVLNLDPGQLNTNQTVELLQDRGINTLVVFGTDLIKPPLLAPEKWTMINMHLGLSPYYRGTATNFYPLLNEEPQFVGATIHRLDAGIDSGPILQHARPAIEADDRPHSIGCKAIEAGIAAMIHVLKLLEEKPDLPGVPQWREPNSRVYYRRDYHPRQVVKLYQKWNSGLLDRYLASNPPRPRLVIADGTDRNAFNVQPESAPGLA